VPTAELTASGHADIRRCARCDDPVRVRAVVTDADAIQKRLAVLRRPRDPPHAA
jgi:hypothetical protein